MPSYFLVLTAVLGCFLLSIWFLAPSHKVVPEESGLSVTREPSFTAAPENTKTEKVVKNDADREHLTAERSPEGKDEEQKTDPDTSGRPSLDGEPLEKEEKDDAGSETEEKSGEEPKTLEGKDALQKGANEKKTTTTGGDVENLPLTTAAEAELTTENQERSHNWSTQMVESKEERTIATKDTKADEVPHEGEKASTEGETPSETESKGGRTAFLDWKLCGWNGSMDHIPCLDNKEAIKRLPTRRRYQHRERHCPTADKFPLCLVPLPKGYKVPITWPRSKNEIWLNNAPHTKLVTYKKDQNWVKLAGEKLIFPGGGTQFKFGASHYIDSVEQYVPDVAWGRHTRVALDIGCGVASFGGSLFDRDVITMSFAPKDEHEAQIQLALERGIPAILAVMGTQRLPFPSNAYDIVHCARCRIHWHGDGGNWLLEVDRVLRPGGYFVWSATPVYRKIPEDEAFWKAMVALTDSMCWNLTVKTRGLSSGVGFAIYQKPATNVCYESRPVNVPPICNENENPDAAWYTPLETCMHKIPTSVDAHGATWPAVWPERLDSIPKWLNGSQKSLFGQSSAVEFEMDAEHWRRVVAKSYLSGFGIDWDNIRNVMDMKAGYGGFAAALLRIPVWVMNVVPTDEPDTLPVIFDRGLLGIYHDWCESFSTYPRTYDLLHVDHLFKRLILRCRADLTLLEMDRILRPQGWVILREKLSIIDQISPIIESLHWEVRLKYLDGEEQLLVLQKGFWRPEPLAGESK